MKNYKKNCWENREKLEKINHKIKKHEIIERINKKKKTRIRNTSWNKGTWRNKNKFKKLETTIMKKRFWDDIEDQETLEILNIQIEKQKLIKLKKR